MNNWILIIFTLTFVPRAFSGTIDWAQPSVSCIESLSPTVDWQHPYAGDAWIAEHGRNLFSEKISAVYATADQYGMPPQVLFSAIKQESGFADFGVLADYGNYSCGISQFNMNDWCEYLETLPVEQKTALNWPTQIDCENPALLPSVIGIVFNEILKKNGKPSHGFYEKDFKQIPFAQVSSRLPGTTPPEKLAWYQAIQSFGAHCSDPTLGIQVLGFRLNAIFHDSVPLSLQQAEIYAPGESFQKDCIEPYHSSYYPLHAGWLLADLMYNLGEEEASLISFYAKAPGEQTVDDLFWKSMNPQKLVDAIAVPYRLNSSDSKPILFQNEQGEESSVSRFALGVNLNHAKRIIQMTAEDKVVLLAP